jgi:putative endonuclease
MLRCSDNTIYSGYTTNINERLKSHNNGHGARYTRSRLPVALVYCEGFETKSDALKREAALKKLTHAQKEDLIKDFQLHQEET